MGTKIICKSKAKATLKLFNQISSYIFEQEFDELKGSPKAIQALQEANKQLAEIIKKNQ